MSAGNLFVAVLFGFVGLAAFRYGKRTGEARPLVLGVVLMVYGYFVSNAWVSLLAGALVTTLLFVPR